MHDGEDEDLTQTDVTQQDAMRPVRRGRGTVRRYQTQFDAVIYEKN